MGGWGIRYDAQSAGSHPMTEDVKVAKLRPCRRRFTTWTRPVARGYRPRGRLDDAAMNVRQLIGKGVARRSTVPSAGELTVGLGIRHDLFCPGQPIIQFQNIVFRWFF